MKNCIPHVFLSVLMLLTFASQAQPSIAQPYYAEGKIRFYNESVISAANPCYTIDISADINANWGTTSGINDVVIYNGKLFVSIDNGNGEGGVLVYNYADVYPIKSAGPVSVLNPQNATGLPVAGIAIQPSTGNLYVGTFYTGASDAGIYVYTAASGYANSSGTQLASYNNDNSIDKYIANLTFDASGNLWFTEFDATAPTAQFLICYKGANKNNYYKVINSPTQTFTAYPPGGGTGTSVYLLSQPEGIAFDASGNLWLGNNNDDYACNNQGDGTLVEISAGWITGTLFVQSYGSSVMVSPSGATVDYIAGGKLGGLLMDGNTLYINDQGQNQGSNYASSGTVWKYDVTTAFNSTNFIASGIHTTYPGNGLMALDNSQFSVATDCVTGISDMAAATQVSLSPNPASTKIVITAASPATISISNIIGEEIQAATLSRQSLEINISSFNAGVYFATLRFADGSIATRKFVKE